MIYGTGPGIRNQAAQPGRAFYVSCIDGRKSALLMGPYLTYAQAYGMVTTARLRANETFADVTFAAFGTCQAVDGLKTVWGR